MFTIVVPTDCARGAWLSRAGAVHRSAHIPNAQIARRASLPRLCTLRRRANHLDAPGHPASPRRGVARDRHDTRGGDAVDVEMQPGERHRHGREIVWSWRPPTLALSSRVMIPWMTVANKPGTPGRARISVKTAVQGMPDVGCTCGSAACFLLHAGHG